MNEETYEALVSIVNVARKVADKRAAKKQRTQKDILENAILYKNISEAEIYLDKIVLIPKDE